MRQLFTEDKLVAEYLGLKDPTCLELEAAIKAVQKSKKPKFETEKRKRYRLHKKVKTFCRIEPLKRTLFVSDAELTGVPANVRQAIICLLKDYNYNLQVEIPN